MANVKYEKGILLTQYQGHVHDLLKKKGSWQDKKKTLHEAKKQKKSSFYENEKLTNDLYAYNLQWKCQKLFLFYHFFNNTSLGTGRDRNWLEITMVGFTCSPHEVYFTRIEIVLY